MSNLRLGSLFDGIGGWLIASVRNGIEPVWASEIEPFPISVTKKHFPNVEHYGDITKIKGTDVPNVDILCAGSPCQGLSVAGKGKGLADERSGLFIEAVRLFFELREAHPENPCRFFIWENVLGSFATGNIKGGDFRAVLESLCKDSVPMPQSGKWASSGVVRSARCDICWRVLDAQFWGVPQRRRRIFLIADFAEPSKRRPEILFECEGVSGNPKKSKRTGKDPAEAVDGCLDDSSIAIRERCGCDGGAKDSCTELMSLTHSQLDKTRQCSEVFSYDMTHACDVIRQNECAVQTLQHRMGTGGNQIPLVQEICQSQICSLDE